MRWFLRPVPLVAAAVLVVGGLVVAALVLAPDDDAGAGSGGGPLSTAACLERESTTVVTGEQGAPFELPRPSADLTIDAREATFTAYPDEALYPVNIGNKSPGPRLCLVGGLVVGEQSRDLSWQEVKTRYDGAGVRVGGNDWYVVDGLRVDNVEDGIDPRGTKDRYPKDGDGFVLRNLYFTYIRDDCVENDDIAAGVIEDSLFDGCYTGISERPGKGNEQLSHPAPEGEELVVRNVLMRLQELPGTRGGAPDEAGHGKLFKWSDVGNRLRLEHSVFVVEGVPSEGETDFPPGTVAEDVTVVWLGEGEFPGEVPDGVRITTDESVWDEARAQWLERHGCSSFTSCDRLTSPTSPP